MAALFAGPLTGEGTGLTIDGGASAGEKAFAIGTGTGSSDVVGSGSFDDTSARLATLSVIERATEVTGIGAESGRGIR